MNSEKIEIEAVIFCAPLKIYPTPPEDYSLPVEIVDCPHCNQKMWLTAKKREVINKHKSYNDDIKLFCFDCFEKYVKENRDKFKNHLKINI